MSETEQRFLDNLHKFIEVARGKLLLGDIARTVLETLRTLTQSGLKRKSSAALGKATRILATATTNARRLHRRSSADSDDVEFLEQVVATIDFALRNGVGILFVVDVLGHDFVEVERAGSLREARKHAFLPKVTHWAKLTPDTFGEIPETP